ncbi:MAG: hypothetical protein C5B44_04960 [Acidobacteria bacterium]|nr:MAG: hypothetical protein C5B44_04960 [Acidobacteriota bacterium]
MVIQTEAAEVVAGHECVDGFTASGPMPEILVLSSSLLTDRMFLHTRFLDVLNTQSSVRIWATSARNPRFQETWNSVPAKVEDFPEIRAFREFPHNYLRRLNEFTWDFLQMPPARLSMMRHFRDKTWHRSIRALKLPAKVLAAIKAEQILENRLEKLLLGYPRSNDASEAFKKNPPAIVFTTGPFQFEQPAIVAAAKNLGIPCLALIPSWDNISTKGRMVFKHDGYIVWSAKMEQELRDFYPQTRDVPVYVVGAPQFDVFFEQKFQQSRADFCASQGLRPDVPIILYAVGSPNFVQEHHGALELAERIQRGELGDVQMLVRPHPIHDNAEMSSLFDRFAPRVVPQRTAEAGTALTARSQDESQITEWVNTFRHADVVVNLSSTATVDGAIFDRPIVNLDFDPEPGGPKQALVKEVNHSWTHFKPVAESGGVWLVNDYTEMVEAIRTYLRTPQLHRERRRWLVEYVCGYIDGRSGDRMAEAVLDFCSSRAISQGCNR